MCVVEQLNTITARLRQDDMRQDDLEQIRRLLDEHHATSIIHLDDTAEDYLQKSDAHIAGMNAGLEALAELRRVQERRMLATQRGRRPGRMPRLPRRLIRNLRRLSHADRG